VRITPLVPSWQRAAKMFVVRTRSRVCRFVISGKPGRGGLPGRHCRIGRGALLPRDEDILDRHTQASGNTVSQDQ
jgi:hypothetical protein